jgi:hypothetical protein
MEAKDRVQAIIKLLDYVIAKPTNDTATQAEAQKPKSFYDEVIQDRVRKLVQRSEEWVEQTLNEPVIPG